MHRTLSTTTPSNYAQIPCFRLFLVLERLCRVVATPGGRILVLLFLVILGYVGAACRIPFAEHLGASALIFLLLVLARRPASPGLLAALLAFLKRNGS
jgi:hypothetical protein